MAKPKASTLQARFGFLDDDLKTSNHDEIMTWLDSNSRAITEQILQYKPDWNKEQLIRFRNNAKSAVLNQLQEWQNGNRYSKTNQNEIDKFTSWQGLDEAPTKPPLEIKTVWEYTVSGANKFVVGFIDMVIFVKDHDLDITSIEHKPYNNGYTLIQHTSEPKYRIPEWYIEKDYEYKSIFFEVKSVLPSLGELIRQIRMYQEFVKGKFYVVAPDDKYAQQLQMQGIGFIKYPEGQITG